MESAFTAMTKNVSARGLGVIANRSVLATEVLICLSGKPDAKLLRAAVRHQVKLGLGWFQLGVEVTQVVNKSEYPQVSRFAATLLS